jgi:hypothetical protein
MGHNAWEYEEAPDGIVKHHRDRILLNGNNICMLVPGADGPEAVRVTDSVRQDKTASE